MTNPRESFPKDIDRMPTSIVLQSHSGCNFHCKFCAYQETQLGSPKFAMDFGLFSKIVDDLHALGHLKSIALGLQCEALLDEKLEERIKYLKCKDKRIRVLLTTNCSLLSPDRFRSLCDAGLDHLIMSLDAMSPESFKRTCSSSFNYQTVIDNIDYVIDNHPNNLALTISSMLIKENMTEFLLKKHPILTKAKKAGIEVGMGPISNHTGSLSEYNQLIVMSELQSSKKKSFCDDIFDSFYILADGDVVGCCSDWNRKFVLGNMTTETFTEIWNKPVVVKRRFDMLEADYSKLETCKNCSQAWNIDRNRKSAGL